MVDMHSHILWNVDDGPKTMADTMRLFEQAVKEGVTKIIATPHCYHPQYHANYSTVRNQIHLLQSELIKKVFL